MDFSLSVYYLGYTKVRFFERSITKNNTSLESYRSNEENVIDQIETAQLDGLLPMDGNGLNKVSIRISKYGARIVTESNSETIDRIPLVNIVLSLAYDDGFGRYNIALVVKARQCEPEYKCYVLQCSSMREADEFLRKTHQLFDSVIDTIDQREADQCEWVDV
ncbi:hypothetical protein TELCIR_17733 [Teladorsagia circumcincta]|uniref:PID domain-containing protein n=1 Tax=Teladorsagia circumcincta TaxID=45464 RepID=A0A2G9TRX1_TELCI|nr:hypothetical protein TELCIR_17733 [Teladorsagia circumcincta]